MGGRWSGASDKIDSPALSTFQFHNNNNTKDVVIIPVDQSKHSEAAFEWYVKHVHRGDHIVRVIHCQELLLHNAFLPDLKGIGRGEHAATIQEQLEKSRNTGVDLIQKYENKLSKYQISGSVLSEFAPSPGEMIVKAVDRYNGTHVVMGTRGFGMIKRTILGSVSQYVVHHSQIPVTVVPPEEQKKYF